MDWFLYDNGLRHERVMYYQDLIRDERAKKKKKCSRVKDLRRLATKCYFLAMLNPLTTNVPII